MPWPEDLAEAMNGTQLRAGLIQQVQA